MSKTMVRVKDTKWGTPLAYIVVDRVSDKSVWFPGNKKRSRVVGDCRIMHDVVSAKKWLTDALTEQVKKREEEIKKLNDRIAEIEAMADESIPTEDSTY